MFFVYVLRSQSSSRHYVGFTADPIQRLGQHNNGITKSTKGRGPWELIYSETFATRSEAMRREKFFKSGQGREHLKELLRRPPGWIESACGGNQKVGSSNLSGRAMILRRVLGVGLRASPRMDLKTVGGHGRYISA